MHSVMRKIFQDAALQADFDRDGYVVLPWLSAEEVSELVERYDRLPTVAQKGFFAALFSESPEFKRGCHQLLADLGRDFAAKHLVDYRPLIGSFVVKVPGNDSVMPCHQDWTFVDERKYATLNLWCALTTTTFENGALHLLPGSHRLEPNIRGTLHPTCFAEGASVSLKDMACVPIEAGQVIVHDHRVLHASPPNLSKQRRLATAICMVPTEAEVFHYFQNPASGRLEVYGIDTDFFFNYTFGKNTIPVGSPFIRFDDGYRPVCFSKESLSRLINA